WDRAKDTKSVAVLEAFIGRFKDTFYAELARARLTELHQAAEVASKKAEEEARAKTEADRQRLAMVQKQQEEERARADAARKKADEEALARAEVERQRTAMLEEQQSVVKDCDNVMAVGTEVAIKACTERIRQNPQDAAAYYNRGKAYRMKKENDLAA